jgi:mannose-6-phosphate isomerase-like protein (cupin superfamily)
MKSKYALVAIAAVVLSTAFASAGEIAKTAVLSKADLKWKMMGNAGVAAAPVSGDMEKGPSRFFLKYPAGLVTPLHHHSANHHVVVVSGSITLTVGGKDYLLGPGAYFTLADKAPHVAKVEGKEEAVFFIEAEGPWDVVAAK